MYATPLYAANVKISTFSSVAIPSFNNRQGLPRPPFRRNEFGGTIGGPIRHNKTFIFADYQGIRLRQPQTIVSTISTLQQQVMVRTGDFSGLGLPSTT